MKINFAIIMSVLTIAAVTHGKEAEKTPLITLNNGKSYKNVIIREVRKDGIKIMHDSGVANIPYEQLPKELIDKYGPFDAGEAAKAREQSAKERQLEDKFAAEADKAERIKELEIEALKLEVKISTTVGLKVVQSLDGGALCKISFLRKSTKYKTQSNAFGGSKKIPYDVEEMTPYSQQLVYVKGLSGVVDGEITGERVVPLADPYIYTNAMGARSTVSAYRLAEIATK